LSCGAAIETPTSAPTETSLKSEPAAASRPSLDKIRFIPGTVLAKRYRIVGLLGRGGMGEVYRADDLKLGQPVALKFLPAAVERDQSRLERFLNEVRTALKVSHPNVCRVYDIGEVEGRHYLSMEYVDGEDMASLLRRIERLPQSKAVQIARQLCAGVATAHEQGILHRDLKPANVMIDGRGRAKITDFGLAGLVEGIEGAEIKAGTPAYMAPEQLSGQEVSVRSDIYSLGLVLYELLTGKRAFDAKTPGEIARLQLESTPTSPSSHVDGMDPAVERVILRCLEPNPQARPESVMAVAAALPGGDPLAAALAAGETPSPEMVAAAGPQGGLPVWRATVCLVLLIAGMLAFWTVDNRFYIHSVAPLTKSYEVLRDAAAELAIRLGYTEPPVDRVAAFSLNIPEWWELASNKGESWAGWDAHSRPEQRTLSLLYRQSASRLVPMGFSTREVMENDPPPSPGDLTLRVNLQGDLLSLRAIPPRVQNSQEQPPAADWVVLFDAAGLDMERFETVPPRVQPQLFAHERAAWSGTLPGPGERPVRIEAAACRGKPVYFQAIFPYRSEWPEQSEAETPQLDPTLQMALGFGLLTLAALLIITCVLLALRSLSLGRGDRRGAFRMALSLFALFFLHWLFTEHHVAHWKEIPQFFKALSRASTIAVASWLVYIALEPHVRRYWPEALVSWSRFLAGRLRDPLIGRHVLIGLAFSAGRALLFSPLLYWAFEIGVLGPFPTTRTLAALRGGRYALGALFAVPWFVLLMSAGGLIVFMFLRFVLRKQWLATLAYCAIFCSFAGLMWGVFGQGGASSMGALWLGIAWGLGASIIGLFVLIRFGILAFMASILFDQILSVYPLTADISAPHFTSTLVGPIVLMVIGLYAFKISLAGRPLFKES
jgi:serine/threonine-protein kinase